MSKNIDQVFIANPITVNTGTDLMYFGQAPYSSGANDAAMTFANFAAQFASNVLTTKGDLFGFSNVNARFPVGTDGQVVQADSTAGIGLSYITATITPTNSAISKWDTHSNLSANNFLSGYATHATTGGTITLTVSSPYQQFFTGSSVEVLKLPVTSTLALGHSFYIVNNSTNLVAVEASDSTVIITMVAGTSILVTSISTSVTSSAGWSFSPVKTIPSPWIAGTGTNSAKGGDGTAVASGTASLSYGTGTNTASGTSSMSIGAGNIAASNNSFAFGTSNHIISGANQSFLFGSSNVINTTGSNNFIFGQACSATASNTNFTFGLNCTNAGNYGFAYGNAAVVNNVGSVVWGDHNATPNTDTAADQFNLTFTNGYRFFTAASLACQIIGSGSGVNYISIANSDTNFSPTITATGSDSAVNLMLKSKAGGFVLQDATNTNGAQLAFHNAAGTFATSLQVAGNQATNLNLQLPAVDGTSGQALTTNGSGVLSFTTPGAGTFLPLAGGTMTGDITWTGTHYLNNLTGLKDASGNLIIGLGSVASAANYLQFTNASAAAPVVSIGTSGSSTTINMELATKGGGAFFFADTTAAAVTKYYNAANTHFTALTAGATTADYTYTLPLTDGTSGQFLQTDGAGNLSFASAGGSSPWTAAGGTGSAIGGDGTATASGSYSLNYSSGSATCAGNHSFVMGAGTVCAANDSLSMGASNISSGSNNSFAMGGATVTGSQSFGFGYHTNCLGANTVAFNGATANFQGSWVICGVNPGFNDTAGDQFVAAFSGGFYLTGSLSGNYDFTIDGSGNVITSKGVSDQSYSLQVPSTGFTITMAKTSKTLILNPAGTLLTGTINLPASPIDGQEVRVTTSQAITTLTVSGNGHSIVNAPTTLALGTGFSYIYNTSGTTWYRLY